MPDAESFSEGTRQTRTPDPFDLFLDVVLDPSQRQMPDLVVEHGVGGSGIPVARLSHTTRIDERAAIGPEFEIAGPR